MTVRRQLALLTPRELELCTLHFVDERSQADLADWFGLNRATVVEHLESALLKVPELAQLRKSEQERSPRIRVRHLSQLPRGDRERGPFNSDEL